MLRLARSKAESRTTRKTHRKERGQSLSEFALTAPMLSGFDETHHAFSSRLTVVRAAMDYAGARTGLETKHYPYARFRRIN